MIHTAQMSILIIAVFYLQVANYPSELSFKANSSRRTAKKQIIV